MEANNEYAHSLIYRSVLLSAGGARVHGGSNQPCDVNHMRARFSAVTRQRFATLSSPSLFISRSYLICCFVVPLYFSIFRIVFKLDYQAATTIIMKVLASSLLVGACAALSPPFQQPLQAPHQASDAWTKPLQDLRSSLKSLTQEARAVWDEVAMLFPEAMDKASFFSAPKKHTRRPDNHWDHIIKGSDLQKVWVANEVGEEERYLDGKLEAYDLRSKGVDPGVLGVDPQVQQYSGYLDDNENDKHLFYCT